MIKSSIIPQFFFVEKKINTTIFCNKIFFTLILLNYKNTFISYNKIVEGIIKRVLTL